MFAPPSGSSRAGGWSTPLAVAALVGARTACNAALTAVVARSVGRGSPLAGTLLSAATTVLVLRPGVLGHRASFVELPVQVALLAVAANPSSRRAVAAVGVCAAGLLLVTVPAYGEAFVAP